MTKKPGDDVVDVAVVGAGVAALVAAQICRAAGQSVRLFDKGRGPGGRLSTRRAGTLRFDHGARSLSVKGAEPRAVLEKWIREGLVGEWTARRRGASEDRSQWVGTPAMNTPVKHEAGCQAVSFGCRVVALRPVGRDWVVWGEGDSPLCKAHRVIVAIPAPQAAELLDGTGFEHWRRVAAVKFDPIWVAMFQGPEPAAVGFETAVGDDSVFRAVDAQASKPGRPLDQAWVAQASISWSRAHLEDAPETVEALLRTELQGLFNREIFGPIGVHRWRYALAANPVGEEALVDRSLGIACCGDWCLGDTVGDAIQSGLAAGQAFEEKAVDGFAR